MTEFSEFGKISVANNTNRAIELVLMDEEFEQMEENKIRDFHA